MGEQGTGRCLCLMARLKTGPRAFARLQLVARYAADMWRRTIAACSIVDA